MARLRILSDDDFDKLYKIPKLNNEERQFVFELDEIDKNYLNTINSIPVKINYILRLIINEEENNSLHSKLNQCPSFSCNFCIFDNRLFPILQLHNSLHISSINLSTILNIIFDRCKMSI